MTEMLDAYARPEEPISNAALDADGIKDTPYQGALPSAERTGGIRFFHENAAAWELLKSELSESEYDELFNAVVEKVGEFEQKTPEVAVDEDE